MKTLRLTNEAEMAIRSASMTGEFQQDGVHQADGMWLVPVGDDTAARLDEMRFPGETDSDLIIRAVAAFHAGGRRN